MQQQRTSLYQNQGLVLALQGKLETDKPWTLKVIGIPEQYPFYMSPT